MFEKLFRNPSKHNAEELNPEDTAEPSVLDGEPTHVPVQEKLDEIREKYESSENRNEDKGKLGEVIRREAREMVESYPEMREEAYDGILEDIKSSGGTKIDGRVYPLGSTGDPAAEHLHSFAGKIKKTMEDSGALNPN